MSYIKPSFFGDSTPGPWAFCSRCICQFDTVHSRCNCTDGQGERLPAEEVALNWWCNLCRRGKACPIHLLNRPRALPDLGWCRVFGCSTNECDCGYCLRMVKTVMKHLQDQDKQEKTMTTKACTRLCPLNRVLP